MNYFYRASPLIFFMLLMIACSKRSGHQKMVKLLAAMDRQQRVPDNFFSPESKVFYYDSLILASKTDRQRVFNTYMKGFFQIQSGELQEAIQLYSKLLEKIGDEPEHEDSRLKIYQNRGLAYMRLSEQVNCISNNSSESCILPFKGKGIHRDNGPMRNAIDDFSRVVSKDPNDLETRWLLNLAHMAVGTYPDSVAEQHLIPGLDTESGTQMNPFVEIATALGLDVFNMSGGSVVDDFDRDGNLDIITSGWGLSEPMHYFRNNGDGTFSDLSRESGIASLTGGLNIMQTDYNNDGLLDVFILRGAWQEQRGRHPNSLLRNNGNGTFTDVTFESGLFSLNPTQTAVWRDFNNDGWLDVFIGNESSIASPQPCELYMNQQDGTFINLAAQSGVGVIDFVKGVTSGDYNNDGWTDIFISTMNYRSYLFENKGIVDGKLRFQDVSADAGFASQTSKTFPTWFFDYDNDGLLDIFLCAYEFQKSLGYYEAAEKIGITTPEDNLIKLYRNKGDGTFTNVAAETGLARSVNAMGANYGDIDNDGFLDIYLGTGNPDARSIVPNRMFRNIEGQSFADVTAQARVGHLQKGHAISFADLDNDGDQDIYMQNGGAFIGDRFQNSLYCNPGQDQHNWIAIRLTGVKANKPALGTQIRITIRDGETKRLIFREVGSGGSFGSSPTRQEIGLGKANVIDAIEIRWAGSGTIQTFTDIKPNRFMELTEGAELREVSIRSFPFCHDQTLP
jgi:tetratricopeptide (TPR) repeat protein